jgi:hypothetical protein
MQHHMQQLVCLRWQTEAALQVPATVGLGRKTFKKQK